MTKYSHLGAILMLFLWTISCGETSPDGPDPVLDGVRAAAAVEAPPIDYLPRWGMTLGDKEAVREVFSDDGFARFEFDRPFQQVGLQIDATDVQGLASRSLNLDGEWSDWEPVDIYFSEGVIHNGLVLPGGPTKTIEFRGGESIEFARIEFSAQVQARQPLIRRYEPASPVDPGAPVERDPAAMMQGRAPAEMVTSRHEWRAIDPDKICNSVVIPNRMTLHHTAGANDDRDPHARMRSTQSFHLNDRGWCDIGYHFIVARNGEILQGRSRANRPGAHVAGHNDGNMGVGMFGNYVEVDPPDHMLDSVARIYRWAHETYGVALNRDVIKGHREWPGTATQCPGNKGLPKLDVIVERALALGQPEVDVSLELVVEGLDDFYRSQSSLGVPDALEGDQFQVELTIQNDSREPLENVELAIEAGDPAMELVKITFNGEELEIPPRGRVLKIGKLPAESSSSVVFELVAERYNFGGAQPRSFNVWVKNIEDVYHQDAFGESPMVNLLGERVLEAQATIDILSGREWHFNGEGTDDLEGWQAIGGDAVRSLGLDPDQGVLSQRLAYIGGGIVAPPWTSIDADRLDELVLGLRSYDGPHVLALRWAQTDQPFDESRQIRFQAPGDGTLHTLVVPLGAHPEWKGEVRRLSLVVLDELWSEAEFVGRYEIDQLYFQSRERELVGSETLELADLEPATMVHRGLVGPRLAYDDGEGPVVGSNFGCAQGGGQTSLSFFAVMWGVVLLFARRRKSGAQPAA